MSISVPGPGTAGACPQRPSERPQANEPRNAHWDQAPCGCQTPYAPAVVSATITTDLLTPLGAYLRLRGMGAASFLLESVERGRLGRSSWMGAGSRLVTFAEAEALGLGDEVGPEAERPRHTEAGW